MKNLLSKIFIKNDSKNYYYNDFENINKLTKIEKIFNSISNFTEKSEIRYVGGSIRKIINKEKVDDIDLATNLIPEKVCEILKKNDINFYESGIKHGTITAKINDQKFEITTLREDLEGVTTENQLLRTSNENTNKLDAQTSEGRYQIYIH